MNPVSRGRGSQERGRRSTGQTRRGGGGPVSRHREVPVRSTTDDFSFQSQHTANNVGDCLKRTDERKKLQRYSGRDEVSNDAEKSCNASESRNTAQGSESRTGTAPIVSGEGKEYLEVTKVNSVGTGRPKRRSPRTKRGEPRYSENRDDSTPSRRQ